MQTLILTIIVLGVLVFIHELGHFVTAKWAGIAVPRFSIGLGPRVFGFRVGETDYCLSAIPFGGYVKMAGMVGEEAFEELEGGAVDPDEDYVPADQRFDEKTIGQRLMVISAGVIMNFLLGWVLYTGLAFHDGITTVEGTAVAAVEPAGLEAIPELSALAAGGTIVAIDDAPVTNWYEIQTAIERGAGAGTRLVLESGATVRVPADQRGTLLVSLVPFVPSVIADVAPGGPADAAGIMPGDRIVSVDGVETTSFSDVSTAVRERPGQRVTVVVERAIDGPVRELSFPVDIGVEKAPRLPDGKFVDMGRLGVGANVGRIELGPIESVVAGTRATWRAGTLILGGLYQLVTGGVSLRALGGPIAIGQLTGHFARQGTSSLLAWVALFSINLAILNLLPIPVLDGGHILFLGIEATRGRPLSARQKLRMSQVGLAFLVLLMVWAFTADILRLVGL